MKYYPISMKPKNISLYYFYNNHYHEIDDDVHVDNDKASFIIKTIIAGAVPAGVIIYNDKVVAGKEFLKVLHYCFTGKLIFTGKLFEQMNGKTWKELPATTLSL